MAGSRPTTERCQLTHRQPQPRGAASAPERSAPGNAGGGRPEQEPSAWAAGFRRLYRCSLADGEPHDLRAAASDDYAECAAHGYELSQSGLSHPMVNAVIRCGRRRELQLATRFGPAEILLLLHPEAALGRSLAEAEADGLLNWSGVLAETDAQGLIVALVRRHSEPEAGTLTPRAVEAAACDQSVVCERRAGDEL